MGPDDSAAYVTNADSVLHACGRLEKGRQGVALQIHVGSDRSISHAKGHHTAAHACHEHAHAHHRLRRPVAQEGVGLHEHRQRPKPGHDLRRLCVEAPKSQTRPTQTGSASRQHRPFTMDTSLISAPSTFPWAEPPKHPRGAAENGTLGRGGDTGPKHARTMIADIA